MPVTLDFSDEVLGRLRAEAARRRVTLDEVVAELAAGLPVDDTVEARKLGFVALGASTDGRSAADVDEILAVPGVGERRSITDLAGVRRPFGSHVTVVSRPSQRGGLRHGGGRPVAPPW